MSPATRMNFTDCQLIALSAIAKNKNQFIRMDLIEFMGMARSNFSSEITTPLEKNKSLYIDKQPSTKKRGRPGSVVRITNNPWILNDIYQCMKARANQYGLVFQKNENLYKKYQDMVYGRQSLSIDDRARWEESREKRLVYFSKYIEWDRRALLFGLHCLDCGLRFLPCTASNQDDKEFTEYYDVLYGHKIE